MPRDWTFPIEDILESISKIHRYLEGLAAPVVEPVGRGRHGRHRGGASAGGHGLDRRALEAAPGSRHEGHCARGRGAAGGPVEAAALQGIRALRTASVYPEWVFGWLYTPKSQL